MKTLSIIIPVFNEQKTITKVLDVLLSLRFPGWQKEIMVVNDGSTDRTSALLQKYQRSCQIIHVPKNQGKGFAIRVGIQNTHGDYVLIQDADLEYNPRDIPQLLKQVEKTKAPVVYGSRFMRTPKTIFLHKEANQFLTFLTNFLYGSHLTDMETCYKLIRRDILQRLTLTARRFEFEPEVTAQLLKKKVPILEVPISFTKRGFSEGKKITFWDGLHAMWTLTACKISE